MELNDFRKDLIKMAAENNYNYKNTINVYIAYPSTYISKTDFLKYIKGEPKNIQMTGDTEIVEVSQEQINQICNMFGLKPIVHALRLKERDMEHKYTKTNPHKPHKPDYTYENEELDR